MSRGINIGLILGNPSGLLNVDLDWRESKEPANIIFPVPVVGFDNGLPESGHYLYRTAWFGSRKTFTSATSGSTLVELWVDRAQTMIPLSIHPNGS